MAKRLTPQEIADKQIRRASAAVGDFKKGVQGVDVSPTEKAAQNADGYVAGIQDAVESGRWQARLRAVSKQAWIEATAGKGADRYASGIAAARPKIEAFQAAYGPIRDRIAATVNAMPSQTLEQRLEKMMANARGLAANKYKK